MRASAHRVTTRYLQARAVPGNFDAALAEALGEITNDIERITKLHQGGVFDLKGIARVLDEMLQQNHRGQALSPQDYRDVTKALQDVLVTLKLELADLTARTNQFAALRR